jgi:predicted ATPase
MKSLSMALTRLRQGVGEVIEVNEKQARATLSCDAKELLESLDKSHWQQANELYKGAFLEGVVLEDWSSELEEWVYTTREYLAERVQYALLNLAEETAKKQDFDKARDLAERAYKLPGLGGTEITNLKRLYPLLCAGRSLVAPDVRKELDGYGLRLELSSEEARARFGSKNKNLNTLPMRGTSFVGRDEELTELATLLTKANLSLLTLLGPAGVGKTRLALQFAHEQQKLHIFKDGVYFVSLDALRDSGLIIPTLLSHFGLTQQGKTEPIAQLTDFIAEKNLLLVLDNFEHLTEGSSFLPSMLSTCPNLKLLVTSREKLNLEEEYCFTLEGLPFANTPTSDAKLSNAVQLFTERAQQVQPHFDLEKTLHDVIKICKLVEGLPLGLELAASWVRLMSCSDIASEIEKGLELLTSTSKNIPERHRSLKAAFEQSWKLLSAKEQEVLRKLSVFIGGFSRETAREVAGATIPVLASLVDKSLLRVLPNGRYDRHPLLYQFTKEKLIENPDEERKAQECHHNHFLHFVQAQHIATRNYHFQPVIEIISQDFMNISTSWPWIVSESSETIFRDVCDILVQYFRYQGQCQTGLSWFETGLSLNKNRTHQALLLHSIARMDYILGNFAHSLDYANQSLALFQTTENNSDLIRIYQLMGRTHLRLGSYDEAETYFVLALELASTVADQQALAVTYADWGQLYDMRGQFTEAVANIEKALNLNQKLEHYSAMVSNLNNLGNVHLGLGELIKARSFFEDGLAIARKIAFKDIIPYFLYNLAVLSKRTSHYEDGLSQCLEALQISREKADKSLEASILGMLGVFTTKLGKLEQARDYLVQSLYLAHTISDFPVLTENLFYVAELYERQNILERAIPVASFVVHHPATTGNNKAMAMKFLEDLRPHFQKEMFEQLCSLGQTITLEQTLEKILREDLTFKPAIIETIPEILKP